MRETQDMCCLMCNAWFEFRVILHYLNRHLELKNNDILQQSRKYNIIINASGLNKKLSERLFKRYERNKTLKRNY